MLFHFIAFASMGFANETLLRWTYVWMLKYLFNLNNDHEEILWKSKTHFKKSFISYTNQGKILFFLDNKTEEIALHILNQNTMTNYSCATFSNLPANITTVFHCARLKQLPYMHFLFLFMSNFFCFYCENNILENFSKC